MKLICLPHAGGSFSYFYNWKKHLNDSIDLYPLELKGRSRRLKEPHYQNLDDAVDDIFLNIRDVLFSDEDYMIFGHSMGSLLAYELYYKIDNMGLKKPKHMFFSGYKAPNIIRTQDKVHGLSDEEFLKEIIKLGEISNILIDNPKLAKVFIPILKNDCKIVENYIFNKRDKNIDCNISILYGKHDRFDLSDIYEWKKHSCKACKFHEFEGGHFFIDDNLIEIVSIINNEL